MYGTNWHRVSVGSGTEVVVGGGDDEGINADGGGGNFLASNSNSMARTRT